MGKEIREKGLELEDMLADHLERRGYIVFRRLFRGKADLVFLKGGVLWVAEVKNYRVRARDVPRFVRRLNRTGREVAEHLRRRGFSFSEVVTLVVARGFEKRPSRTMAMSVEEFLSLF